MFAFHISFSNAFFTVGSISVYIEKVVTHRESERHTYCTVQRAVQKKKRSKGRGVFGGSGFSFFSE